MHDRFVRWPMRLRHRLPHGIPVKTGSAPFASAVCARLVRRRLQHSPAMYVGMPKGSGTTCRKEKSANKATKGLRQCLLWHNFNSMPCTKHKVAFKQASSKATFLDDLYLVTEPPSTTSPNLSSRRSSRRTPEWRPTFSKRMFIVMPHPPPPQSLGRPFGAVRRTWRTTVLSRRRPLRQHQLRSPLGELLQKRTQLPDLQRAWLRLQYCTHCTVPPSESARTRPRTIMP